MRRHPCRVVPVLLSALILLGACAGRVRTTTFLNPEFDFSYLERVAVLPFENMTSDRQAGFRATRLMITELLASGAVDVVEPGEVRAAINKLPSAQVGRFDLPSTEELVTLGRDLNVQAILIGSVPQAETLRTGQVTRPVVTLDVHMVEVETGATIWAATHTETGNTVGARVLGTGGSPMSEITRRCVKKLVAVLVD